MKLTVFKPSSVSSLNIFAAALLAGVLAACGGGSDSAPANQAANVPTSGTAALTGDEQQAQDLVDLIVSADDSAVNRDANFKRVNGNLVLSPPTGGLPATVAVNKSVQAIVGKRFSDSVACEQMFDTGQALADGFISSCAGSVTFDSNFDEIPENSEVLPAGYFINIQYNNMTVNLTDGRSITIAGAMNTTITSPVTLIGDGFSGGMQVSAVNLSGIGEDGEVFGPESFTIDITFNADGTVGIVSDGVRINNLEILGSANDDDSYLISSGSVIQPYGQDYAEVSFENWNVIDGVPQAGSVVFVEGTNGSATVTVVSSSATSIEFRVDLTVDSSPSSHTVIASVNNGAIVVN